MNNSIGHRVSEVRGELSQAAFAARLGVHKNTVGATERNQTMPGGDLLQAIYREFGISPTWVLTGDEPKYTKARAAIGVLMMEAWEKAESISLNDICQQLDVSSKTFFAYVNGDRLPEPEFLSGFAEITGYPLAPLKKAAADLLEEMHEQAQRTGFNTGTVESPAAPPSSTEPTLYMAMSSCEIKQPAARAALNSSLLLNCLSACTAVYGEPFQAQSSAVQMEYAANFYSLLERMAEAAPTPGADTLKSFNRLETPGLADLLRTFIKLGWPRTFPPLDTPPWAW